MLGDCPEASVDKIWFQHGTLHQGRGFDFTFLWDGIVVELNVWLHIPKHGLGGHLRY